MVIEDEIYRDFAEGDLKYMDAIQRLEGIGYDSKEAERIVSEWADGLEAEKYPPQLEE